MNSSAESEADQSVVEGMGGWPSLLGPLCEGKGLSAQQSRAAMEDILAGRASDARLAAFIVGLRLKGETSEELVGLTQAMLEAAEPLTLPPGTVDIVGTGGSKRRRRYALNVSTMASFVAAACGLSVCKHGNRKASSTSGSFDFLESLGVKIDILPKRLEDCVETVGLGFAFARTFHPAMRFVGPVRQELGVPTVFNVLGPLAHPGRPAFQIVGTSTIPLAATMAEALRELGVERAWVVTGHEGFDELTLSGPSHIFDVSAAGISEQTISASDAGLSAVASIDELAGGTAAENAEIFKRIISGQDEGPKRDIVLLNAAAALLVSGKATTLSDGVKLAVNAIDDGLVTQKVRDLRSFTSV